MDHYWRNMLVTRRSDERSNENDLHEVEHLIKYWYGSYNRSTRLVLRYRHSSDYLRVAYPRPRPIIVSTSKHSDKIRKPFHLRHRRSTGVMSYCKTILGEKSQMQQLNAASRRNLEVGQEHVFRRC